ncbi:hypothetical protein V8C35DRAFT_319940 [Trichoderma chlorosporum]
MTNEEKALYQRVAAAADAASVTRAEKNQIFHQPPPDEEDRLCKEKTGLTMEELRNKLMTDLKSVTDLETKILLRGATYNPDGSGGSDYDEWLRCLVDDDYRLAWLVRTFLFDKHDHEIVRRAVRQTNDLEAERALPKVPPGYNPFRTKMTPEQKELFQRVAAAGARDPASLTRADENQIFRCPPPDEEDRLCKEKTGLTLAELKDKVMTDVESLTELETELVLHGVTSDVDGGKSCGHIWYWQMNLPDDERELSFQVTRLFHNDYDLEVSRRARSHSVVFEDARKARLAQRKKDRAAAQAARIRASKARWVNHMLDAKMRRWGFVVFRTAYGDGTEQNWDFFGRIYRTTRSGLFSGTRLHRANNLISIHEPMLVSDPSLEGADLDVLRQRFKEMRKRNEIPDGIATDCFLVADQVVLSHPVVSSNTMYDVKGPGEPDPWQTTFFLRAVNPDYDASAPVSSDPDLSDYEGVITIPLPKALEWLYYCSFSKSEDWETRYKVVKGGAAEPIDPKSPYPAYRPGTEPAILPEVE